MRPQKFPDMLGSLEGNTEGPAGAWAESGAETGEEKGRLIKSIWGSWDPPLPANDGPAEVPGLRGRLGLHQPLLSQVLVLNVGVIVELVQRLQDSTRLSRCWPLWILPGPTT